MSIEDFIDNVMNKDFTSAQSDFEGLMHDRMHDALEQQKVAVAGTMFGEEDPDVEDITDDDIEAALDEEDEE